MRAKLIVAVFLVTAASVAAATKIPPDAWKTGTLQKISESSMPAAPSTYSPTTTGGVHRTVTGRSYPVIQYTIESDGQVYEAFIVFKHNGQQRPSLTVNNPVKFALVKSKFYVRDDTGKQYNLALSKKYAKPSTP